MASQSKAPTSMHKTDKACNRPNKALFQRLQTMADETKVSDSVEEKWGEVQQSIKQWKSSRETLVQIQELLVQAYRELELMKTEK